MQQEWLHVQESDTMPSVAGLFFLMLANTVLICLFKFCIINALNIFHVSKDYLNIQQLGVRKWLCVALKTK